MAAKVTKDILTQESTGAVEFDGSPVEHSQTDDANSTGAVDYAAPGETKAEHLDAETVVRQETGGPVTVSLSWLSEAQAKVVEPPEKAEAKKSSAKVKAKG